MDRDGRLGDREVRSATVLHRPGPAPRSPARRSTPTSTWQSATRRRNVSGASSISSSVQPSRRGHRAQQLHREPAHLPVGAGRRTKGALGANPTRSRSPRAHLAPPRRTRPRRPLAPGPRAAAPRARPRPARPCIDASASDRPCHYKLRRGRPARRWGKTSGPIRRRPGVTAPAGTWPASGAAERACRPRRAAPRRRRCRPARPPRSAPPRSRIQAQVARRRLVRRGRVVTGGAQHVVAAAPA